MYSKFPWLGSPTEGPTMTTRRTPKIYRKHSVLIRNPNIPKVPNPHSKGTLKFLKFHKLYTKNTQFYDFDLHAFQNQSSSLSSSKCCWGDAYQKVIRFSFWLFSLLSSEIRSNGISPVGESRPSLRCVRNPCLKKIISAGGGGGSINILIYLYNI